MTRFDRQLRDVLDRFADELEKLFLREALVFDGIRLPAPQAMREPPPPSRARPGKPAGPGGRRTSARRPRAEIERVAERIYRYIQRNPGQKAKSIKIALDLKTIEWEQPMKLLLRAQRVRRMGPLRHAQYIALELPNRRV